MDEELRELEQAGQKAASAVRKGMHMAEESAQALLDVSAEILGVAAKPVQKANNIEKDRHMQKKTQRMEQKQIKKSAQKQRISDRLGKRRLENFYFTGKKTDLSYFVNTDRMPLSAIDNIPDSDLQQRVATTFDRMCSKNNGLVQLEGDEIVITDKGKKMLKDEKFKQTALSDQLEAYGKQFETMFGQAAEGEQQLAVALNGDGVHDFAFYGKSDALDLNQIVASPNANLRDKISQNVKLWQSNGLVEIKDNVARITEQGRELIENTEKIKEAIKGMKETVVEGVKHTANSIVVTTKTVTKEAAEKAQQAAQVTAEATKAAAKATAEAAKATASAVKNIMPVR